MPRICCWCRRWCWTAGRQHCLHFEAYGAPCNYYDLTSWSKSLLWRNQNWRSVENQNNLDTVWKSVIKITLTISIFMDRICDALTAYIGVLKGCIQVYGDWLPRHIFGKCTAFCAIVRMLYLSFTVLSLHLQRLLRGRFFKSANNLATIDSNDELIFMDGVSAPLPLFFFASIPSIFYCHFPDKVSLSWACCFRSVTQELCLLLQLDNVIWFMWIVFLESFYALIGKVFWRGPIERSLIV